MLTLSMQRLLQRLEQQLCANRMDLTPPARITLVQAFERLERARLKPQTIARMERNFHVCEAELVRVGTIERRLRDRRALEYFVLGDTEIRHFLVRCPYLSIIATQPL
jgi:hypothetical protein